MMCFINRIWYTDDTDLLRKDTDLSADRQIKTDFKIISHK
jgi:hypothetical protein